MQISLLSCVSVAVLAIVASPAIVQDAGHTPAPAAGDDSGATDIIVSAQRLSMSLLRVPVNALASF